ncbi:amidase family protein [Oleiphilus messinensis]|uniref:Amidase family protein n=1 Tax=Oleiphilus messinensis TaxID=141451 RepID=A0A1Y0ID60_9GAMM|nr:allophanate hydrolase [Oleiphilus messinensis]ARU58467.1 amidase family protein [Oleiphilus messinensis]
MTHHMNTDNTENLSIQALRAAYRNGLTPQALIPRLREQALVQSEFNAWITVLDQETLQTYINALEGKSAADLPLYGVPFAIKDNIDLAGVPTTAACPDFSYTPDENAPVVQRLIDAGAIPLGKTNLDQFATGLVGTRSPYGEAKNSFNPEYISGGSSAGSAIATALGQVSFALGTDTAGSGRVPAALNNLVGLKPGKGLISTRGVVPACRSLDCVSLFTLNCDDAATLLDIVAQFDPQDPFSRLNSHLNRARYYPAKNESGFTFAVPENLDFQNDDETRALFIAAMERLQEQGGTAVKIDFSPFLQAAQLLYQGPWVAERALATAKVHQSAMLPAIREIIGQADNFKATDCFTAQYTLAALKRTCDALIRNVDFVLTPTLPTTYTRAQINDDPIKLNSTLGTYTNFMNLLDYAAVAIPAGFNGATVPWGVTLFSFEHTEIQLLSYGRQLHRHLVTHQGNTRHNVPENDETSPFPAPSAKTIDVVVCGAHLAGQPLNWQLTERQATLVLRTQSAPCYELFVLPDGKRPAMVRNSEHGSAIEVEVWRMPQENFGSFVAGIPTPLGIGKVELSDGQILPGFICEDSGTVGAQNITRYGGWRRWLSTMG